MRKELALQRLELLQLALQLIHLALAPAKDSGSRAHLQLPAFRLQRRGALGWQGPKEELRAHLWSRKDHDMQAIRMPCERDIVIVTY